MGQIDLIQVEDYLVDLLPKAGRILEQYFTAKKLTKRKKGKLDLVTAADLAVDLFLRKNLAKEFPGIPLLTEETAPKDISSFIDNDLLWVIDPLDGTVNFSRGNTNFAISVGLVSFGKTLIGTVYIPFSRSLFLARQDKKGAFLNGKEIKVSQIKKLEEAVVITDLSHLISTKNDYLSFFEKTYGEVRQLKIRGCAVGDLTDLAQGKIDVFHLVHAFPWDYAAASLIAQKAGGVVTDIDGGKWNVFTPGILAANPILHKKILNLLS